MTMLAMKPMRKSRRHPTSVHPRFDTGVKIWLSSTRSQQLVPLDPSPSAFCYRCSPWPRCAAASEGAPTEGLRHTGGVRGRKGCERVSVGREVRREVGIHTGYRLAHYQCLFLSLPQPSAASCGENEYDMISINGAKALPCSMGLVGGGGVVLSPLL